MAEDRIPPMPFVYDGEAMVPKFPKQADHHYVVGETVYLEPFLARSKRSHDHYFAVVEEAWKNLPEDMAERFAQPDPLRYFALIKTGFRSEENIVCTSQAEALRWAEVIRRRSPYAITTVAGGVVRIWEAESQSLKAMGRERFQASKTAVLDFLAQMIGVDPVELSRARAA